MFCLDAAQSTRTRCAAKRVRRRRSRCRQRAASSACQARACSATLGFSARLRCCKGSERARSAAALQVALAATSASPSSARTLHRMAAQRGGSIAASSGSCQRDGFCRAKCRVAPRVCHVGSRRVCSVMRRFQHRMLRQLLRPCDGALLARRRAAGRQQRIFFSSSSA